MKAKLINEKLNFKENSDPIKDMEIGLNEYEILPFDWAAEPEEIFNDIKPVLEKMGVYLIRVDDKSGSDMYFWVLSKARLTKRDLKNVSNDINQED